MTQSSETPVISRSESEILNLLEEYLKGGDGAPFLFCDFLQEILGPTILSTGQSLRCHSSTSKDVYTISGPKHDKDTRLQQGKQIFKPLKLNNGNYLYVFYECYIDRARQDFLTVKSSKLVYQLDFAGTRQLFRFEYTRFTDNRYPSAHLHVCGKWTETLDGVANDLPGIHFPVVRFSVEGTIRLLVNEFGLEFNRDPKFWSSILDKTERRFHDIMTKNRTLESEPH